VVFSFAFWAAIFHRDWSSCIDVAIVLTMYIKLCIFVYICVYNCVYYRDVVFDFSHENKFIINHNQASINMLHTHYIAPFATR